MSEEKKNEFITLYNRYIKRDGADRMLDFLSKSDFFTAPASTRFHLSREGGLCEHSINVFRCLEDYLSRSRVREEYGLVYEPETVAVVSLLHDVCKINCYAQSFRNVKDEHGVWQKVPCYEFDDKLPYGHGEKSVYIISGFMRLTREESFAVRYHMGFSSTDDARNVGSAYEMFPLAAALSFCDMEATYFVEKN